MGLEFILTVLGTASGVAGVCVAVMQLLRSPGREAASASEQSAELEGASSEVGPLALGAPTGRLAAVRGRGELLDQLGGRLARPDGRFQVLAGLGGAGKTTVALALAARAQDEGRPVWWISAADAESVRASLIALASELGAPVREVEGALSGTCDPSEVLWRRLKERSGWLLVLDNADDPGELAIAGAPAGDGTGWLRSTRAGPFLLRAAGPEHEAILRVRRETAVALGYRERRTQARQHLTSVADIQ